MVSSHWTLPEQFDEYRLVRLLGRGSMGVVFLGHDLVLDRPVAIKFLNAVNADDRARERFLTEARAAARIAHPNVMAAYRVGELEGRLYIIGEYIRGQSLSDLKRPMPWQELLKIGVGLARGLACAHRMGVLHRDIKLANAMLNELGEVKLLDFSLAKLFESRSFSERSNAVDPVPSAELDATIDPEAQSNLPRVVIDSGARGGRTVESRLTASPPRAPDTGPLPAALDSTLTRVPVEETALRRVKIQESSDASVVGTPYYMAPELWRAEPATRSSDVYALGVLLYILGSGRPPIEGSSTLELARLTQETAAKPLRAVAPWIDPRLAEIVDRCLRPADERYPSADELCTALENLALGAGPGEAVRGNPYRGLQAFEARHRAVFFGRGAEIRAVVDRLRAEPFVLVAGDSGVGKSSLCRAGVLPVFSDPVMNRRSWTTISLMPGRRPLQTIVSALASTLALQEAALRDLLTDEPAELLRMLARRHGRDQGLVFFIDQLEELVTLADRSQLRAVGRFLAELANDTPGIRLLATVRGDFLTRVAALPHVGPHINAAIYLLTPLSREGVREAIVGPAQLQHVEFDSDALIEELVTAGAEGGLPLMQFALAELWEARDPATRKITMHDLERIGRVTGALARHADNVVDALPPQQRIAVRRLLMRLVTIEDTRASLSREELVGDPQQEAALEALVRGRLVVVREAQDGTVHEIAHEALIRSWGTLQRWISEEREAREVRHRLELAALEWQRLGSGRVGLWSGDQLTEAALLERESLRPRELAFLRAGQLQLARSRRSRLFALLGVPLVVLVAFVGLRVQQARELARRVDEQIVRAQASLTAARGLALEVDGLRTRAHAEFDAARVAAGEATWRAALATSGDADRRYRLAIQELELGLNLDAGDPVGRGLLADALYERALGLEAAGKRELADELIERLAGVDEHGHRLAAWDAPGRLSLRSTAARVTLVRYEQDPTSLRLRASEPRDLGALPLVDLELPRGSYRLTLMDSGGLEVHRPFVLRRGESLALDVPLPRPSQIPPGFVYIPAGRFLFGSADDEVLRRFFGAAPQHQVHTEAFLIARHETTYQEWLAYLRELGPAERARRLPAIDGVQSGVALSIDPDGVWSIVITTADGTHRATEGRPIDYPERSVNVHMDWLRMPAAGINVEDAHAYLEWLGRSGRVPGARLCSDLEWEHATRGSDGRQYPHGDRLEPPDANFDLTYEKRPGATGPDEVGAHPGSRGPFELDDAAGNVWEWARSTLGADQHVARGGAFTLDDTASRSVNRVVLSPETRDSTVGLRVCATPGT